MLIVEGPDGAGKSTLVAKLEETLGLTREPRAVSKEAVAMVAIDEWIEQELAKGFGRRLYDRFALISSPMYMMMPEPTFSGELLSKEWLELAWTQFSRIRPIVIMCLPPWETVQANVLKDPDNTAIAQHIWQIYHNYHNWMCTLAGFSASGAINQRQTMDVLWYDYTQKESLNPAALRYMAARLADPTYYQP